MLSVRVTIPKGVKRLDHNANKGLLKGLVKAGIILENEAKASGAFKDRTGNLRNSIGSERPNDREKYVDVKARAEYAKFIEFGTVYIRAFHFMRNAAKKKLKEMSLAIDRSITKEMRNDHRS